MLSACLLSTALATALAAAMSIQGNSHEQDKFLANMYTAAAGQCLRSYQLIVEPSIPQS